MLSTSQYFYGATKLLHYSTWNVLLSLFIEYVNKTLVLAEIIWYFPYAYIGILWQCILDWCSPWTSNYLPVHEITAGHRSLSGTISCVADRIRFLPVTMTGRFSNFNSISYTEDRHELRVTGIKYRLPDTMCGTGEIFISGAVWVKIIYILLMAWWLHPLVYRRLLYSICWIILIKQITIL